MRGRLRPRGSADTAPAGAVASIEGRSGGAVFVIEDEAGCRVVAGHPEHPDNHITLDGIDPPSLRGFATALEAHLQTRSGERPQVPYDEAFPASVQLVRPGVVLNVYDDGDDFSVMAVAEGAKARHRDRRERQRCAALQHRTQRDVLTRG